MVWRDEPRAGNRLRHRGLVPRRPAAGANPLGTGARSLRPTRAAGLPQHLPRRHAGRYHRPEAILGRFVWRWRIETTFQEVRRHLGVETQRQWSDLAILRTTPVLLGLFSLVTLWADDLMGNAATAPHPRAAAWYAKPLPTFSDAIAAVRRALWCPEELSMSRPGQATIEIPITLLQRLVNTVGYAA